MRKHGEFNELFKDEESSLNLLVFMSPAKSSKYLRCLFEFYSLISIKWVKQNINKLRTLLLHLGSLATQMQLISLVLNPTHKSASSFSTSIRNILEFISFNENIINSLGQNMLTYISLGIIFLQLLVFLAIYIQLLFKKKSLLGPLGLLFKTMSWAMLGYLRVPMITYAVVYVKHAWFSIGTYVEYFDLTLEFNPNIGILFLVQLVVLAVFSYFDAIFQYSICFSTGVTYSRPHSLIAIRHAICVFLITSLQQIFDISYFYYACIVVGGLMIYSHISYLPYYSNLDNLICSGIWMTLGLAAGLSLVKQYVGDEFEVFLSFIVLLPFLYLLLFWVLKLSYEKKIEAKNISPYIIELKIRKIYLENNELSQENIESIRELFKEATIQFIEFRLIYVWECNFERNYMNNPMLAKKKLLKTLFSAKQPSFFPKKKLFCPSYSSLETGFHHYSLSKEIEVTSSAKDLALIKFIKNMIKANNFEVEACYKLLEFIDADLSSQSCTVSNIMQKAYEFSNTLRQHGELIQMRLLKNNQYSAAIVSNFANFKDELLTGGIGCETSQSTKKRENKLEKLIGNNSEHSCPTIIVSGHSEGIGTIIYSNNEANLLLHANSLQSLVGLKYTQLIHPPFDKMHKNILENFFLFGNNTEIRRPHLIVCDLNKFAVEITLQVRLAICANSPYFIIEMIPKSPKQSIFLCSVSGEIFGFSEENNEIANGAKYVQNIFPGILDYFESSEEFEYRCGSVWKRMEIRSLQIENQVMKVLYLLGDEEFNSEEISVINVKESLANKPKLQFLDKTLKRGMTLTKRKQRSSASSEIKQNVVDITPTIVKSLGCLKWLNIVCLISLIILIFSWTLVATTVTNDEKYYELMDDMGKMRFTLSSILLNFRSLDLQIQGYKTAYSQDIYKENIATRTLDFENILLSLGYYKNFFDIEKQMKNTEVQVITFINTIPKPVKMNLFDGLIQAISISNSLLLTGINDTDSLFFIYNNAFSNLFESLNTTLYYALEEIKVTAHIELENKIYIKLLFITPILMLIIISIPVIVVLERINRRYWTSISEFQNQTLLVVRTKAIERINKLNGTTIFNECEISRAENVYLPVWKKYFFMISVYLFIVVAYMLIMNFTMENSLNSLSELKVNHKYWGGLRRSLTYRTYFASREIYFEHFTNISYSDLMKNYYDNSPLEKVYRDNINELIEKNSMLIRESQNSGYNFDDYVEMMILSPCDYDPSLLDCQNSIISKGIYLGLKIFHYELDNIAITNSNSSSLLITLESDTILLANSLHTANDFHRKITDSYINTYKQLIGVLCSLTSTLLFICTVVIIKRTQKFTEEISSLDQIVMMFKDSKFNQKALL